LRHPLKIVAALGAASLLIAGCGKPSSSTATEQPTATDSGSPSTGSLKACMVLDIGGVDDHSFNQSSWAGMQAANKANPNIKISYVGSNSQNDYVPNLTAETNKGCDTVIAVGGLMADAVYDPEFLEILREVLIAKRRAVLLVVLERGRLRGELRPDADLDVMSDLLFGALWYRLLVQHAKLDGRFAKQLVGSVLDGFVPR